MFKQKLIVLMKVLLIPLEVYAGITSPTFDLPEDIEPVKGSDFYQDGKFSPAKITLGQQLFFDKILSGNKNIACASCHHPKLGTSDGVALSLGEGAVGLGKNRRVVKESPVLGRVPRNSQALYFLGAKEYSRMFHDGRVEVDTNQNWPSGFWSPAREQLPEGLDNVLAVQAMFPVSSDIEMAGHKGENKVATAIANGDLEQAWDILAKRLQVIPDYVQLFIAAYPHIKEVGDIRFVDAANAIAAFETVAFRADNSPFDQYLRTGDLGVLTPAQQRGMQLFYGRANCSSCHSGKLQSDQKFHAIAMPQIGPGKNDGWDNSYWQATGYRARLEDYGRAKVTYRAEDKYQFRTPSLRNVELTAPYGHAGVFNTLEEVVRHHADPLASLDRYTPNDVILPPTPHVIETTASGSQLIHRAVNPERLSDYLSRDTWVVKSANMRKQIARANVIKPVVLKDRDIDHLVAFLKSLTDPSSRHGDALVPENVASGLSIDN